MNISQNIVIKKSVKKGNSYITECQQMYRKSSFAIVGCELQEFLDEELRNDYSMQQSPKELTEKLHKMFNNYVIEDEICLHNDIEYLVIIKVSTEGMIAHNVQEHISNKAEKTCSDCCCSGAELSYKLCSKGNHYIVGKTCENTADTCICKCTCVIEPEI